ncbi:hypothetical protein NIES4101_81320 [Calothrix sp. NIES-4101]|nr:hypothetical protein NIES4101_81320 [Calothrix sp. NIES-4101]
MKSTKVLLTAIALSLSMIPTLPAQAANGQITCDRLIRNNGYSVVSRQAGQPTYRNGRIANYRYVYTIRNNRFGRRERPGRGRYVTCIWNVRRDSARLVSR